MIVGDWESMGQPASLGLGGKWCSNDACICYCVAVQESRICSHVISQKRKLFTLLAYVMNQLGVSVTFMYNKIKHMQNCCKCFRSCFMFNHV